MKTVSKVVLIKLFFKGVSGFLGWYIMGENRWYIVGEIWWYILAEIRWYIYVC